jgi:hypothetical protein
MTARYSSSDRSGGRFMSAILGIISTLSVNRRGSACPLREMREPHGPHGAPSPVGEGGQGSTQAVDPGLPRPRP